MTVRIVAILLVVLQMLVPPGICICQFVPHADADEHEAMPDNGQPSSCCACCCGHSSPSVSPGEDGAHRDVIADSDNALHTLDYASPADCPHLPGCPALRPADHHKPAQTADPVHTLVAALVQGEASSVKSRPVIAVPGAPDGPPRRPLYLTFRTLLI
jgi:hypothetical protein